MNESKVGVYGLGVMGGNIALNMLRNGYDISVYSKDRNETDKFRINNFENLKIFNSQNLKEFIQSLEIPRKILLMITAGKPVDEVINELIPFLDKGDIIIDGGNSFYKDTNRRHHDLKKIGLNYIGVGISGGEKGALNGPSMMPSGEYEVYEKIEDIFSKISAKASDNKPCCAYIGKEGSGHFVKMVHNGIEYADMQIICEAYEIMKKICKFNIEKIQSIFEKWNKGILNSYLIEITSNILKRKDKETGDYLINKILDKAGQKGTGKWAGIEGLEMGVPVPSVTEAVFTRNILYSKEKRIEIEQEVKIKDRICNIENKEEFTDSLEKAVYLSKISAYAQGFELITGASERYDWNLDIRDIVMIWREGSIVKSEFLEEIAEEYENKKYRNLMLGEKFKNYLSLYHDKWREIICTAIKSGVYIPVITSSLEYFDGCRNSESSAGLLQAQRDYFGAHTYERTDREGNFHTEWE